MKRSLDHEGCSERLHAFVAGRLPSAEAEAVQAHLETCERCRAEHSALKELLGVVTPLNRTESETLRSRILAELRSPTAPEEVVSLRAARPGAWRGARLLAAAALILGGAVFVGTNLFGGMGGQDSPSVAELGTGESTQVADVRNSLRFNRVPLSSSARTSKSAPLQIEADEPAADQVEDRDGDTAAGGVGAGSGAGSAETGGDAFGSGYRGPPRPLFVRGAGRLDDRRLRLVGRYGLPLVLFPQAYTTADATELQEDFLIALANATESEAESQQVIDCGAQVLSQDNPVLPALATFGTYDGEPTFVLALAWTEADRGPLDRFMVWTWPAGDCDQVPGYRAGRIGV